MSIDTVFESWRQNKEGDWGWLGFWPTNSVKDTMFLTV